jgi:H+/Cl- antiporter ClcA
MTARPRLPKAPNGYWHAWIRRCARHIRLSSRRSRRRLTFLAGGIVVGAAAVVFAYLADEMQLAFGWAVNRWTYAPMIATPLGFMGIVYLTRRFVPNSKGSGIPQTIAARRLKSTAFGQDLISIRVAVGKIALTLLGLLCGASIGREGPTVQVGAAIMSKVGTLTRIQRSGLILGGACAGVAAAFNTPLAGIVFGIEEMSQSFERSTSGLTLTTVIVAGLTALSLVGNYTYFGAPHAVLPNPADWLAVPVCGVLGGVLGAVFSRIVIAFARGLPGRAGKYIAAHPLAFAGLCGLAVAFCGLLTGNATFGTGYAQARGLLDGTAAAPATFGIVKIAATLLSAICGIPGGIFSPSLAIGAGLGSNLGFLFPHADPGALFLLGMVAYLTGVVQAPITAFVIVTEMADAHGLIMPLMVTAAIAHAVSRLISAKGIYHALAESYLRGPEVQPPPQPPASSQT